MNKIKIDKGVKIPERQKSAGLPEKYPFSKMSVGDSFECDSKTINMQNTSYAAGERLGCKFAVRSTEKGCRVWRVK